MTSAAVVVIFRCTPLVTLASLFLLLLLTPLVTLASLILLLLLLLAVPPRRAEAITCSDVISYVGPCVTYIAKGLRDAASTAAVRPQFCSCLKSEMSAYSGLTLNAFDNIVSQCRLN